VVVGLDRRAVDERWCAGRSACDGDPLIPTPKRHTRLRFERLTCLGSVVLASA
jgi:hypothetical protein